MARKFRNRLRGWAKILHKPRGVEIPMDDNFDTLEKEMSKMLGPREGKEFADTCRRTAAMIDENPTDQDPDDTLPL